MCYDQKNPQKTKDSAHFRVLKSYSTGLLQVGFTRSVSHLKGKGPGVLIYQLLLVIVWRLLSGFRREEALIPALLVWVLRARESAQRKAGRGQWKIWLGPTEAVRARGWGRTPTMCCTVEEGWGGECGWRFPNIPILASTPCTTSFSYIAWGRWWTKAGQNVFHHPSLHVLSIVYHCSLKYKGSLHLESWVREPEPKFWDRKSPIFTSYYKSL